MFQPRVFVVAQLIEPGAVRASQQYPFHSSIVDQHPTSGQSSLPGRWAAASRKRQSTVGPDSPGAVRPYRSSVYVDAYGRRARVILPLSGELCGAPLRYADTWPATPGSRQAGGVAGTSRQPLQSTRKVMSRYLFPLQDASRAVVAPLLLQVIVVAVDDLVVLPVCR